MGNKIDADLRQLADRDEGDGGDIECEEKQKQNQNEPISDDILCRPRTSSFGTLRLDLQTTLMDEIECFDGVTSFDDTRDIYLVRALADHLYVHVALSERGEHPSGDTHKMSHLLAHERQNCHVTGDSYLWRQAQHQSYVNEVKTTCERETDLRNLWVR